MIVDAICTRELFEAAVELNNGNGFNLRFVDANGGCCGGRDYVWRRRGFDFTSMSWSQRQEKKIMATTT